MNNRGIRAIFIAMLFIGLGLAVAYLLEQTDLRAMQGRMNAHHTLSTSTVASPLESLAPTGLRIRVVQDAPSVLLDTLQQELIRHLHAEAATIPFTSGHTHGEERDQPLLLVEITAQETRWIPLLATSELTVEVVYASDGDLSWRHAASMVVRENTPAVHARGKLVVTDRSTGLISAKAYQKYLGEGIAAEIVQMIRPAVFDPPGW